MTTLKSWPQGKYPDEVLDYEFDWTDLLDGDSFASAPTAEALGSTGLTVDSISTPALISTVWVSGGTPSLTARIKFTGVTVGDRTIESVVRLPVLRP